MSRFAPSHKPVLLDEVINLLELHPGQVVIDGTVGLGGHAKAISEKIGEAGKLICFDRDNSNLEIARTTLENVAPTTFFFNDSYHLVLDYLKELNIEKIDRVFLDLGISSVHVDDESRGFAYRFDGPLDMRFDNTTGKTAAELLATIDKEALIKALKEYGEVKLAVKIANKIKAAVKDGELDTTSQLVALVESSVHFNLKKKVVSQVFQAVRILVNNELNIAKWGLEDFWRVLDTNGVIGIISFHSVEDRIVKKFFQEKLRACICPMDLVVCECAGTAEAKKMFGKVITASEEEVSENPRSRSAKLRVYKRLR